MNSLVEPLLQNSKQALFAAIEIHNKPVFPYRYEVSTITLINAWELLFKAYIAEFKPEVKLVYDDGSTKQFEECLACVASDIGNQFAVEGENIKRLYEFRCNFIHFYDDHIDPILYGLLAKSVQLYSRFLLKYFNIDLCEENNLILLPVGFKPPISPLDFLSKRSNLTESSSKVQEFIKNLIESSSVLDAAGLDEPIMYTFSMSLENEKRVKNADIVAAITKEPGHESISVPNIIQNVKITNNDHARAIRIDEESLFLTVFTESSRQVYLKALEMFPTLKQNKEYRDLMAEAKDDPNLYRVRFLDVKIHSGTGQGFYSQEIYAFLADHYVPPLKGGAVEEKI